MTRDQLSPAMLFVLAQVRDGEAIDGRSWRAVDALQRRELIALSTMPRTSPVWRLTDAGTAALEAATPS